MGKCTATPVEQRAGAIASDRRRRCAPRLSLQISNCCELLRRPPLTLLHAPVRTSLDGGGSGRFADVRSRRARGMDADAMDAAADVTRQPLRVLGALCARDAIWIFACPDQKLLENC